MSTPNFRPFVDNVIAENLRPASDFPFGPYPSDKLTYRSDHLVEFITPSNAIGLRTRGKLTKGRGEITGFATIAGADKDLLQLNMRLSPSFAALGPVIIQQAEHETERYIDITR